MFNIAFDSTDFDTQIAKLKAISPAALSGAMKIGGLQFLTWANAGSPRESAKPPIKWGVLRGSASVFLGSELVGIFEGPGSKSGEANTSYGGKDFELVWGWNAEHATKMHETDYNLGPASVRDGDSGPKWAEKHLDADADATLELIAYEFGKGMGTL